MHKLTDSELIDELKKRFDENEKALNALGVVNRKLEDVNKKLQESEALKSNFLSNIRNEINNPLTSILCTSKMLSAGEALDGETIASLADGIYTEAFNLDLQLKNIFAAAELEAGETFPNISKVDIDMLITGTVELFVHKAAAKKINVSFDSLYEAGSRSYFITDPEKLQLIIINLLSNAIEYSRERGEVELNVSVQEKNLIISVKDYGPGIDKSNQGIIFDRFKQLDTGASKSHLGHGLGLSVTKALVEMLNGTISVESEKGRGATFAFSIPEADIEDQADVFSGSGNEFIFEEIEEY
ncbi:MAG: HAMP domain-containing histidine kinase [Nitrospirae bacterium]|nr:HAMP domain-containing histidine kinase [Nitrospirota bacterium]